MVSERDVTPERQLLKLIEESKGKKDIGVKAQTIKRKNLSFFSFGAWIGRILFFKNKVDGWGKGAASQQIDIAAVNRLLFLAAVGLVFYFGWNIYISIENIEKMPALEINPESGELPVSSVATSSLKDAVSFYLEDAAKRNLFEMGPKKKEDVKEEITIVRETTSAIVEMTKHLKLVGISWSSEPYAMVEDTKAVRTFFVKKGQMIEQIQVRAIMKDKVILSYDGEEIELR